MVNEKSSTVHSFALVKIIIQIEPLIQLTTIIKGDTNTFEKQ